MDDGETRTMKTVCVTGAGGFVASWLVQLLLSRGDYLVRGTVRDPSDPKNAHLMALDGSGERLRLFKADLLDRASVAAAVASCDGVFHVASPVLAVEPTNPDVEVLAPAVTGTRNVLEASHAANVRRVVVVSSVGAVIMNPNIPDGDVVEENCWSDEDYCRTTKNWYCLSKTLAEREALAYGESTGMDVVTVCPPWVLGPLLQPAVNATSMRFVTYLKGENTDDKMRNMVDLRDVAEALVLTYETPEASGRRRYICSAHAMKVSETVGLVSSLYPDLNLHYARKFVQAEDEKGGALRVEKCVVTDSNANPTADDMRAYALKSIRNFPEKGVNSKRLQALGWKFRAVEETLRDTIDSYRAAGILN